MSKRKPISGRTKAGIVFLTLTLGFGMIIIGALIRVIWVTGDEWRVKASDSMSRYIPQKASRGNIYSSDGKTLATTIQECDLYLDFTQKIEPNKKDKSKMDTIKTIVDSNYRWSIIRKKDKKSGKIKYDTVCYRDSVCIILHEAFPGTSVDEFRRILDRHRDSTHRGCALIKRHLPYSDWDRICRFPGWRRAVVRMVDDREVIHYKRFKTYGNMAESVIGFNASYSNDIYSGLEGYYDSILKGQDGKVLCRRLTRGTWLPVGRGSIVAVEDSLRTDSIPGHPVIDGKDIVATIDTRLQDMAHYSLEKSLRRYGSSAGCAILMEVSTGNVLVCSSLVLDTNGNYRETPNRNVPLTDLYEPGSIFKPVLLTAMYNDTSFALDTSMLLPVGVKTFSKNSQIVKDHGVPNATYPLWKAVAISSNVAFCELAWRYYGNRRDTLLNQVKSIFPYKPMQVDIKGPEYVGRTNTLRYDNNFLRFCYGYTSSVSPLRMATFYNALANGGRMVKPRFCRAIIDNGKVEELPIQYIHEQICEPKTAETIRDLLVGVVEGGTGDNIKNETYAIAGKTGTAETAPGSPLSNVTFVGFFPANNPKYTCLVMMRDVRHVFGRNAAPVFLDIADCVVSLDKDLDCRPTLEKLAEKYAEKGGSIDDPPTVSKAPQITVRRAYKRMGLRFDNITKVGRWSYYRDADSTTAASYEPYKIPTGQIPNCYGMTIRDALHLCRTVGIDVTFEGYGKVYAQEPKARTPLAKTNNKVHLMLKP